MAKGLSGASNRGFWFNEVAAETSQDSEQDAGMQQQCREAEMQAAARRIQVASSGYARNEEERGNAFEAGRRVPVPSLWQRSSIVALSWALRNALALQLPDKSKLHR